jgi:IstB-like ATP binding protein
MSNVLSEEKKQQVIALGRLGWTLRRIEQSTGVRRETAGAYLKAAGIAVRPPGAWGRRRPPATEASGEIAEATIDRSRKQHMELLATVPLLIIDDLGMRKLPATAAEDLLEIVMRRYERASTLLTSNRPVEDWGKLLGDSAAVTAMLDRLLHHGHVLKCGPRSWRTKMDLPDQEGKR